jgi:hypothetical protein
MASLLALVRHSSINAGGLAVGGRAKTLNIVAPVEIGAVPANTI